MKWFLHFFWPLIQSGQGTGLVIVIIIQGSPDKCFFVLNYGIVETKRSKEHEVLLLVLDMLKLFLIGKLLLPPS